MGPIPPSPACPPASALISRRFRDSGQFTCTHALTRSRARPPVSPAPRRACAPGPSRKKIHAMFPRRKRMELIDWPGCASPGQLPRTALRAASDAVSGIQPPRSAYPLDRKETKTRTGSIREPFRARASISTTH
eukprot:scaffold2666_cov562-Prasinococcus_capsulatus_cf.AAC.3